MLSAFVSTSRPDSALTVAASYGLEVGSAMYNLHVHQPSKHLPLFICEKYKTEKDQTHVQRLVTTGLNTTFQRQYHFEG